jgi:hypothetical protein|nr:MAG: hypothetical protein [Caudoviricetes sp.]
MEKYLIDKVSQFTLEQIHHELYQIKRDLDWLDDSISLTKDQRQIYNDINTRVKKLLGCR